MASRESMGAWNRRVAGWVLKALAAVLTFVVVYRVTVFFDRGPAGVTAQVDLLGRQVGLLAVADLLFGWVARHVPTYRPRYALLDFLEQSRVDSPEFAAAALQHFRWRSRVLSLVAASICLFALVGLAVAFDDVWPRIPVAVLGSLCLLLYGAMKLKAEMGKLRALAGAAGDDASRSALVRSLAYDVAGASADEISRTIWRRIEPEMPATVLAGSAATSTTA